MNIEEAHKQEMHEWIKQAVEYLEMAMNVVECDNNFNEGQSETLDKIYHVTAKAIKSLESI